MTKIVVAIPKRADISDAAFHAHWRDPHGPLALNIRRMRAYVQAHRVRHPALAALAGPYEGFAEVWVDDLAAALGLGSDPDYHRYLVPDEPNFCDVAGLRFVLAEEEQVPCAAGDGRREFKLVQLLRCAAATRDRALDDWGRDGLDAAAAQALGAVKHVRLRAAAGTRHPDGTGWDAVRELWWSDRARFEAQLARAPESWAALLAPPELNATITYVDAVDEYRLLGATNE